MRTTVKQLESAVQRYAELTGKNYILRMRDRRVGGYGVCTQDKANGSQGDDIVCGKASEVYNEMWAKIRAIEEFQQIQTEVPQFLIRIEGGIVQDVTAIGKKKFAFLQIVMDAAEPEYEFEHEAIPDEMTTKQVKEWYIKKEIEEGSGMYTTDGYITDGDAETICTHFL